jgi:hypothetical protein
MGFLFKALWWGFLTLLVVTWVAGTTNEFPREFDVLDGPDNDPSVLHRGISRIWRMLQVGTKFAMSPRAQPVVKVDVEEVGDGDVEPSQKTQTQVAS